MPSADAPSVEVNEGPVVNASAPPSASINVSVSVIASTVTLPVFSTVIVYVIVSPRSVPSAADAVLISFSLEDCGTTTSNVAERLSVSMPRFELDVAMFLMKPRSASAC